MNQVLRKLVGALLLVTLPGCALFGGGTSEDVDFDIKYQTWSFDYRFPVLWDGVTTMLQNNEFPLARKADPTVFPAIIVSKLQREPTSLTDKVEFAQRVWVRIERLSEAPETYRVGFAVVRLWREKGEGDDDWEPTEQNPEEESNLIRALRREMERRSFERG